MTDALIKVVVQGDEAEAGVTRISAALGRLERSEPTMALRSTRRAIDELATSATGLHPALGRVISTFAEFGIGGVTGLAAVGGLAAIGLEVKNLIGFSGELEKSLEKLNTKFASLGGAGASGFAQLEALRAEEPSQPGFFGRLFARLGVGFGSGEGQEGLFGKSDEQVAIETGMAAQQTTLDLAVTQQLNRIHALDAARKKTHDEEEQRKAKTGREDELKRIGLEEPFQQILDLRANRSRFHAAGFEAGQEWGKAWLEALKGTDIGGSHRRIISTADFMARTRPGVLGPALLPLSEFDNRTAAQLITDRDRDRARGFQAPVFGAGFSLDTGRPFGKEEPGKEDRNAEKLASVIGREIGPLIAAFSGGGARGVMSGAGGIAATLASLNDPKTGKALLGSAAPWLSLAGGVLSGISSLFGGQKPKVIITAFEEEAARQIKELRGEPATTQFVFVGPDARGMQQQLNRLNRTGVISRLPR